MYLDFSSPNRPGGFQDYDPTSRSSPYGNYDPGNYRPSPSPPPGMWSQEGISESWRDSLLAQLLALMHGSMGQTLFGQAGQVSMDLAEAIPTAQAFPKRKTKTEPDKSDGAILGQAGQVSALLADALAGMKPSIITPQTEPRLPAVSPVSSVDRREIHVTADLEGVDPHLQQVVINTMLEIERNRG